MNGFEIFTWIIAVVSLAGVILNLYKNRLCFYLWIITNLAWAAVDFQKGIPAQGTLQLVYFILAIWGVYKWKKDEPS